MQKALKRTAAVLLAWGMVFSLPLEALAATKPINSVSIKVESDIEAGGKLPDIETGEGKVSDGKAKVSVSNSKYYIVDAEWLDKSSKEVKIAEEPRMKVTLEPEDVAENYFLASYKESNVKISGGTFVSARREGDNLVVTLMIKPIKGEYDPPKNAFWNEKTLGEAKWDKPENTSGYYEVQLYRDGKSVHKVDKISALKYNFYPYMTKEGEYTFKVRTIMGTDTQKKYGKKSEWIESGELNITDRYVSDGKGQQNKNSNSVKGTEEAGWFKENDKWSYRYPDGSLCRGKWECLDGQWYYFNVEGIMQTGWQNIDGRTYFLYDGGQMAVGWTRLGDNWYYFLNEEENGRPVGSMTEPGWRTVGSNYYYFNQDGSMYTGWLEQNGKWYYLNTVDNSLQGALFTGWITRDNKTYFTDSNGEMAVGWYQIDGNWYYFYPGSGEMARDASINGLYVNQDGILVQ